MFFCESFGASLHRGTVDSRAILFHWSPASSGILTLPRAYNSPQVPCSITYLQFVPSRAEIVMCVLL
jgi:hypothetical protein